MLPKISIITPSYNQGKYIKDTIDSVLSQKYSNLEYIIIDGKSSDNTVNILKSYGNKIKWISEKDMGQSHAINKGLKLSSGEIIAYLNSDDIYLPGTLKGVADSYIDSRRQANWFTGDCIVIDQYGRKISGNWLISGYKRLLMKFFSRTMLFLADSMLPQPSTFWTRSAFKKIGYFNENYKYVMDYDYWIRLSLHFAPLDLKIPLSAFRMQPDSKSEKHRIDLMREGNIALKDNGAKNWHLAIHNFHSFIVRFFYNLLTR